MHMAVAGCPRDRCQSTRPDNWDVTVSCRGATGSQDMHTNVAGCPRDQRQPTQLDRWDVIASCRGVRGSKGIHRLLLYAPRISVNQPESTHGRTPLHQSTADDRTIHVGEAFSTRGAENRTVGVVCCFSNAAAVASSVHQKLVT